MSRIPIQNLTEERFRPYGCIISHQFANPTGRDWQVVAKTESTGWCIGILELKRDVCPCLERHLDSRETHEPVSGVCVLLTALPECPEQCEAFLLDQPVCLHEKVWHQVMAISETAVVKVIENLSVPPESSENYSFSQPVRLELCL